MPANPDQPALETGRCAFGLDCQKGGLALIFDETRFV